MQEAGSHACSLAKAIRRAERGFSAARGDRSFMSVGAAVLPERFRDPRLIARGGMGEVYCATDVELGRVVAIKVLDERFADDETVLRRFRREALAAARVSSEPGIVTIFDVG